MPLAQRPGQDSILDELRTIEGITVYEGQYLTDGAVPKITDKDQGLFEPYITTVFGASYKAHSRGIVSERYESLFTSVTVYVVSPDDSITRDILDQVRDKITGFVPVDGTALVENGGFIYVDADQGPNRYVHSIVYTYYSNMQW